MKNENEILQLMEMAKFVSEGILPKLEVKRREALIDNEIAIYSSISESFNRYFSIKSIKTLTKLAFAMAELKPISDNMLRDYIEGISILRFYFKDKRDKDAEDFNRLMEPALKILTKILCSDSFKDIVIKTEVTGQIKQKVGDMTIPFTPEEIKLHAQRMKVSMIIPGFSIEKIEADFQKYNKKRFTDEPFSKARSLSKKSVNSFIEFLKHSNKDSFINILKEKIIGKTGKDIAAVIRAMEELDILKIPERGRKSLYRAMKIYFGDIGSDQGIDKYMVNDANTSYVLREQIDKIKKELSN